MLSHLIHSPLSELSREHCVAICSFLVPINLLITLQTLVLVTLNRPLPLVRLSVGVSLPFAFILMLHVGTWLMIGVIHPFTFILLVLATICMITNLSIWAAPEKIRGWILGLFAILRRFLLPQQLNNRLKQEVVR